MRKLVMWTLIATLVLGSQALARPGQRGSKDRKSRTQTQRTTTTQPSRNRTTSGAQEAATSRARLRDQMSQQQEQNLTQLQQDLAALKAGSQVTDQQKQDLAGSMSTLVQGTTKPDPASVAQLSSHLSDAIADGNLTKKEQAQLAQDVAVVLNSANIPPSEVQAVIADVEEILISSGVSRADVAVIVSDLEAISQELQSNVSR